MVKKSVEQFWSKFKIFSFWSGSKIFYRKAFTQSPKMY